MTKKRKLYTLTDEHRAQLKPWAERWIANAMSTKAMDDTDRTAMVKAVHGLYAAAKLPPPKHIVFVPSPFVLRFAGGFAAAIWYRRRNTTDAATDAATAVATYAATAAATDGATRDATHGATADATDAATHGATADATRAVTDDATAAATYDATADATRAATAAATYDATRDATHAATADATYAVTDGATRAATAAATDHDAWYSCDLQQVINWVAKTVGDDAAFWWQCAQMSYNMWQGGNQWSAWDSFLSFFRHICQLVLPEYDTYQHWESAAIHGGPRIMHPDFCMISDRPEILLVDEQNRPHCTDGPFCRWRDGSSLYALHGVHVPRWLVETPAEQIDPRRILTEQNVDVRREIVRKVGIDRVCHSLKTKTLDRLGEYELLELKVDNNRWKYLKMHNPSVPEIWHVEGVGNECSTVREALHWRKPQRLRDIPVSEDGEDWYLQGDVAIWPDGAKAVKEFPSILT